MQLLPDEASYPISFREEDTRQLAAAIAKRNSVELIGMKRVGISNFLRYVIYRPDIVSTYVHPTDRHLFIPIDLNDLIEVEMLAFWTLTLKRLVDVVNTNTDLEPFRAELNEIFLRSIQLRDLFYTVDAVRTAVTIVSANGLFPTLFFIRFDRMLPVVTPDLLQNLKGMIDATGHKLSYVLTTHRTLHELAPDAFPRTGTAAFYRQQYLRPAQIEDTRIILETFIKKYDMHLPTAQQDAVLGAAAGHVQFVQLSLLILKEQVQRMNLVDSMDAKQGQKHALLDGISDDERLMLQSEELYETLTVEEKKLVLESVDRCQTYAPKDKIRLSYLWDAGYINEKDCIFSPYFHHYLRKKDEYRNSSEGSTNFSRKEHLLNEYLMAHLDSICEREDIIRHVWPECNEIGVSDWAVDRLVARLRQKLQKQSSPYRIQTIKTRGFVMKKA
ncbi:MAG: helix-turn-helix domain-containing protein [Patescibacteria group bacterium]